MNDLGPLFRTGPEPQTLRYSFEKAGLTLNDQPIPWNADSVIVEATFKLPASAVRQASDFSLRIFGRMGSIPAEILRPGEKIDSWRLAFRFPVPAESTHAEIFFKHRSLGQLTLPVVSRQEFHKRLTLEMPTVAVKLGEQVVACQTFVSTQCLGLVASAVIESPTSLAPLADSGLTVEARSQKTGAVQQTAVQLSGSQLKSNRALVSAILRKPRTTGAWMLSWKLGERELASRKIRAISRAQFHRSLRLAETRFLLQECGGAFRTSRDLPGLKGIARVGPCFVLASNEPGMAGWCTLRVLALVKGAVLAPLLQEQDVLITDGPLPFAPGTVDAAELEQLEGFELRSPAGKLGQISLSPVPAGSFTSEGSFKPALDFVWTSAAEDQLSRRLRKLIGE